MLMFLGELKTKTCYYGINPLCRYALVFRGQPVKVLGDKRYFIYYIERIYHPDTILSMPRWYVFLF